MDDYEALEELMVPDFRDQILEDLETLGVPLAYANEIAAVRLASQGALSQDRAAPISERYWDIGLEFAPLAEAHYSARIPAEDFEPFLHPIQRAKVEAAGLNPKTVGRLVAQGTSSPIDVLHYVFRMPPSLVEASASLPFSVAAMKELYDRGVTDVSEWGDRGQSFFAAMHKALVIGGYTLDAFLACYETFGETQFEDALQMGVTAEQARECSYIQNPWATRKDIARALHPDMPSEYLDSML